MRRAVRLALLTALLTSAAPPARAADEGAERDAQARFEEGLQRAKSGDFDAARISFTQAYAVLRRPRIAWNLALSEEKTGHTLDALGHFKLVARDPSATDADRDGAHAHVTALYALTGHIEVRGPAGAIVTVDGGPLLGTTPLAEEIDVSPGRHVVEARLSQGMTAVTVDAAAGGVAIAAFGTAEPQGPAHVSAPPSAPAPAPAPVSAPAPASGSGSGPGVARVTTVVIVATAAVAATIAGGVLGIASTNDSNNAARLRNQLPPGGCYQTTGVACSQLADAVSSQNRESGLSTGMYVTAGVLAVAAVVTWFVWPKNDGGQRAAFVAPVLGPGVAGLSGGAVF